MIIFGSLRNCQSFSVILGCLLVGLCGDRGYCDEQEYRLTRYLMSNYDPAVRPSENASLPLSVKIQVLLQKIQQLVSTPLGNSDKIL